MTDFFEKSLTQTLRNEGVVNNGKTGYVNSKNDSGGETNYGITKVVARQCGYNGEMCDLPKEKAVAIYKNEYWIKSGANRVSELSFNIAFLLFDFAVNSGVGNAVTTIQKVFNEKYNINPKLAIDGVFGNKTLNAFITLQSYKKNNEFIFIEFEKYYISKILKYYTSLKKPKIGFQANGVGWVNRVANNIDFLNGL